MHRMVRIPWYINDVVVVESTSTLLADQFVRLRPPLSIMLFSLIAYSHPSLSLLPSQPGSSRPVLSHLPISKLCILRDALVNTNKPTRDDASIFSALHSLSLTRCPIKTPCPLSADNVRHSDGGNFQRVKPVLQGGFYNFC